MAELVVRVAGESDGAATAYAYEFRAADPDGSGPLRQEFVVEPAPDLIRVLCREIDQIIAGGPRSANPESAAKLDRNCRLLFDALFPASDGNLPGLVKGLREAGDGLLIRTNAASIPWELLRDEDGFLALRHDLGRRPIMNRPAFAGRPFTGIRTALVVGDPDADLERVCSWLTGHGVRTTLLIGERATLLRVADELTSSEYDLLHFSGELEIPAGGSAVGLRLSGGDLLDRRALEPLARSGLPPVVFLNGRATGELAAAFLEHGTKAVVGTRHPVDAEPARAFTERCYGDLMAGASAGAAVRAARESLRESDQLDWANFVLFGDPGLRGSDGDTRPAGDPFAAPLTNYPLDAEAAELMARVVRQAGPFGLATSMDLLVELMSTENLRERVRRIGGTGMLDFVDELLGILRESQAPAAGDRVELSGTVTGVLNRAQRRARESGRDRITVRDLLAAFLSAGAGRAGELLERLGIPAALLAGEGAGRPGGNGARRPGEPLFDAAGTLRADGLEPVVLVALRVAGLLASTSESVTSTGLLLYGFAVAGGPVLREALRAQGAPGIAALDRLSAGRGTERDQLSSRTQRVLAKSAAGQPATESAVLREILAEPDSSARTLLTRLGIDPDRLLAAINRPGA